MINAALTRALRRAIDIQQDTACDLHDRARQVGETDPQQADWLRKRAKTAANHVGEMRRQLEVAAQCEEDLAARQQQSTSSPPVAAAPLHSA